MQSGLVLGWTGMVREMVRLLKEELDGNYTVIATGGSPSRWPTGPGWWIL